RHVVREDFLQVLELPADRRGVELGLEVLGNGQVEHRVDRMLALFLADLREAHVFEALVVRPANLEDEDVVEGIGDEPGRIGAQPQSICTLFGPRRWADQPQPPASMPSWISLHIAWCSSSVGRRPDFASSRPITQMRIGATGTYGSMLMPFGVRSRLCRNSG